MLFSSIEYFAIFLPAVCILFYAMRALGLTGMLKPFLIAASLFFYGWWKTQYLLVLCGSIVLNHFFARGLGKTRSPWLLAAGVGANLTALGYFKYMGFFLSTLGSALNIDSPAIKIALPLGISFFTFQQIEYLVDIYKNRCKARGFADYALFVSFFPQLIAGPIVNQSEMMHQYEKLGGKSPEFKGLLLGIYVFSIGLFKKIVIADSLADTVKEGFDTSASLTLIEAWCTSLAYTLQLYFDFSGYADMAIGSALLFGISIPDNFDSPYKSANIRELWRRWHMTLGRFLKDYLYVPLGGNRGGRAATYRNLAITFLLAGLWHGAGWMFILWGGLHGAAMIINRAWQNTGLKMHKALGWFLTFNFINVTWVFFRAAEIDDAIKVLRGMAGLDGVIIPTQLKNLFWPFVNAGAEISAYMPGINADFRIVLWLLALLPMTLFLRNSIWLRERFDYRVADAIVLVWSIALAMMSMLEPKEFLYFNF